MDEKEIRPLSEAEIEERLKSLPGWEYEENKISKTYEFGSFTEAVQFVNGLVMFCNHLDHHPDIGINYKKVKFELTRYSIGEKVTEMDFEVARKIEEDYEKYSKRAV